MTSPLPIVIETEESRKRREAKRAYFEGFMAIMETPFAAHPSNERRTRKMVYLSKVHKISLKEILQEAEIYWTSKGQNKALIQEQLDRTKRYYKSIEFKKNKKSAWIIYWNYAEKKFDQSHIIAIFDSRNSNRCIESFIIHHYLAHQGTLEEKVYFSSHIKEYPYKVEYEKINGVKWSGSMSCGHNPFITARIVRNLCLSYKDKDDEIIHWDDFKPTPPPL